MSSRQEVSFGVALTEVVIAASDVASERLKDEIGRRIDGVFASNLIIKIVGLVVAGLATFVAVYSLLYHGILMLLTPHLELPYAVLASHSALLILAVLAILSIYSSITASPAQLADPAKPVV